MWPNLFKRLDGGELKGASNNWVVHGDLTASGKPLLCNDPHLSLMAPSIWVLMHLEVPGQFGVIGASFVGLAGVVIGRNRFDVSWGVTNTGADVQDTYLMNTTDGGASYFNDGVKLAFQTRTETIKVKDGSDINIVVRTVPGVGPVITDNNLLSDSKSTIAPGGSLFGDNVLALRWVSIDESINDTTMDAFLALNNVSDYDEFRTALRSYVAPAQNFIYGDATGNIGYQV